MPRGATRPIAAPRLAPPTPSRIASNSQSPSRSKATSCAPSSRRPRARSALRATAVTCAPAPAASWTAKRPTPPAAPVTSTRLPSTKPAISSARSAVRPATGSVAACAKLAPSGSSASWSVRTATSCAQAPLRMSPTTRAPAGGPLPSSAARSTTPATSQPGIEPAAHAGQAPRLAAIQGEGAHPDEGLGRQRLRVCDLGEDDVRRVRRGGQGEHAAQRTRATVRAGRS